MRFSFRNAIILSLGLHVAVTMLLSLESLTKTPPQVDALTVEFLEERKAPSPEEATPKSKQIVEQDEKSLNNEVPVKEAYLSAANQRVEKESVARERGEFRNLKNAAKQSVAAKAGGKKQETPPEEKPQRSLRDLMGNDPIANLQRKPEWQKEQGLDGATTPGSEASRSNDYLKDVAESGETLLNTREFKYYTYYSRIRRQLAQYWEPKVKTKLNNMFRQGRRIASDKDHITKLLIILDQKGVLVGVQVVTESGVNDLDEAATDAFRAAAPFPNPPAGIVDSDGTVKIRWDFVLES